MCFLQIGELSSLLSNDFKDKYNDVPWRNIKDMRNIMAHKYGSINSTIVWETITGDLPSLRKYCEYILKNYN